MNSYRNSIECNGLGASGLWKSMNSYRNAREFNRLGASGLWKSLNSYRNSILFNGLGASGLWKSLKFNEFDEFEQDSSPLVAPRGVLKSSICRIYIYTFRENQEDVTPRHAFGVYIRQMEGFWHVLQTFHLAYMYAKWRPGGDIFLVFTKRIYIYAKWKVLPLPGTPWGSKNLLETTNFL